MRLHLPPVVVLVLVLAGCSSPTDETDSEFLRKAGWTVAEQVASHRVTLPERFADEPGAFPLGFYWAYNNELSKDVGLDMAPYAGKEVTAVIYRLNETLADSNPNKEMRAVVVRHEGRLAGAYLDRMGHMGFAASLKGRTLGEITRKPLGQWLEAAKVVDWGHPTYQALKKLEPEEMIRIYYGLLNSHSYEQARTMHSLQERTWYLFANRKRDEIYNAGFEANERYGGGVRNIRAATVKNIGAPRDITREVGGITGMERQVVKAQQYGVSLDLTLARETTSRSGPHHYFINVVKEMPLAPWLLDGWGTGP